MIVDISPQLFEKDRLINALIELFDVGTQHELIVRHPLVNLTHRSLQPAVAFYVHASP